MFLMHKYYKDISGKKLLNICNRAENRLDATSSNYGFWITMSSLHRAPGQSWSQLLPIGHIRDYLLLAVLSKIT